MSWQTLQRAKKYALRRFKHFHNFNPSSPETSRGSRFYNDDWWIDHDDDIPSLLGHYRKTGNARSNPYKDYEKQLLRFEEASREDLKDWLEEKNDREKKSLPNVSL